MRLIDDSREVLFFWCEVAHTSLPIRHSKVCHRDIYLAARRGNGINKASNGYCNCAYFECDTMSDKFKSLDANEKAALESTLYRCRALVGRIGEELRKKKPEHFVDEKSLADLHASLERAAWVLEQKTAKG
jgi:hypothetical protein